MAEPGRLRIALAKKICEQFKAVQIGQSEPWPVVCEPENILPARGAWRTNVMLDSWRWEAMIYLRKPDGSLQAWQSVGSYQTLAEMTRPGMLTIGKGGEMSNVPRES